MGNVCIYIEVTLKLESFKYEHINNKYFFAINLHRLDKRAFEYLQVIQYIWLNNKCKSMWLARVHWLHDNF